jgi:hypothetical protein
MSDYSDIADVFFATHEPQYIAGLPKPGHNNSSIK